MWAPRPRHLSRRASSGFFKARRTGAFFFDGLLGGWLVALQAGDQRPQEHAVEAQLAGGGHLLEQRRADAQHRHRGLRTDGGGTARAAHVAGLAEAVARVHRSERLAVALHAALAVDEDVEAIVHLAFLDDLFARRVVGHGAGAQHLPDLGVGELVEEAQAAQHVELRLLVDARVLLAQALVHARELGGEVGARFLALVRRLEHRHGDDLSSSSGTSLRCVWIGGGVAYTIWCSSLTRLPARNGRMPVSSSYITAPSEYRSE